ncbi:MAG TPA: response regulator transcription factor [Egibacteraceae bacterium]|nr:response regulator transcription factor [Egibacteraceae bacterium]
MRILIVDDDRAVRDSLRRALELHGYEAETAPDGIEALRSVQRQPPDAMILDVNMPGVDGFGLTRRLRQDGVHLPILMLTARDAVPDRVAGLDTGADDYLVKPFALEELLARLRVLLRRAGAEDRPAQAGVLRFADLELDPQRVSVRRGERELALSRTEYELLLAFMENPGRVLTRDVLHERVWGADMSASNTLEVYVGYLRRKLEAAGEPRLVQTVRGFGYALREP